MSLGNVTFKVGRGTEKIQTERHLIGSAMSGNHHLNVQLSSNSEWERGEICKLERARWLPSSLKKIPNIPRIRRVLHRQDICYCTEVLRSEPSKSLSSVRGQEHRFQTERGHDSCSYAVPKHGVLPPLGKVPFRQWTTWLLGSHRWAS